MADLMELLKQAIAEGQNFSNLVQEVQIAESGPEQQEGLTNQPPGTSMIFPDSINDFTTKGMDYNIDIQKYSNDGHLVQSYRNVPPGVGNLPMGDKSGTVIETPSEYKGGGPVKYQDEGPLESDVSYAPDYNPEDDPTNIYKTQEGNVPITEASRFDFNRDYTQEEYEDAFRDQPNWEHKTGTNYPWSFENPEGYQEWDKRGVSQEKWEGWQRSYEEGEEFQDSDEPYGYDMPSASEAEVGNEGGFYIDEQGKQQFKMASGAVQYDPLAFFPAPLGILPPGTLKAGYNVFKEPIKNIINRGSNVLQSTKNLIKSPFVSPTKSSASEVSNWMGKYYGHPQMQQIVKNRNVGHTRNVNDLISGYKIPDPHVSGLRLNPDNLMYSNVHKRITDKIPYKDLNTTAGINKLLGSKSTLSDTQKNWVKMYRDRFRGASTSQIRNPETYSRGARDMFKDYTKEYGFLKGAKKWWNTWSETGGVYHGQGYGGTSGGRAYSYGTEAELGNILRFGPGSLKSTMIHEASHLTDNAGLRFLGSEVKGLGSAVGNKSPLYDRLFKRFRGREPDMGRSYYTDPTEIKARMLQLRHKFNLMPGDKYTSKHYSQSGNLFGMKPYLKKDPDAFINIMNKYYQEGGKI